MTYCRQRNTPQCPIWCEVTKKVSDHEARKSSQYQGTFAKGVSFDRARVSHPYKKPYRPYRARIATRHVGYYASEAKAYMAIEEYKAGVDETPIKVCIPNFLK